MASSITRIVYAPVQGETPSEEWEAFGIFVEARLHLDYPRAVVIVDMQNAANGGLWIKTRKETENDAPGEIYRARRDAEESIKRLWDDFCSE